MTQSEFILSHLNEIRRRSIVLWEGLPVQYYYCDEQAMTAIQMIRYVLEADYGWNIIIQQGSSTVACIKMY